MKIVKDKQVEVNLLLLQEMIDYLQEKPYHEVHLLINKIVIASNNIKE